MKGRSPISKIDDDGTGRGGWIRTTGKRNQNPMPYRLDTPPVLRQGIEPKSAAYESAALPLSYLNVCKGINPALAQRQFALLAGIPFV